MTENELLASIRKAARDLGWLEYHTVIAYRSPRGFPDLVLARGLHLVIAELKSDKGKVTPEQETWLAWWREFGSSIEDSNALARAAGLAVPQSVSVWPRVDVFVWRPPDLEKAYRILATGRAA
ncbi:MAG: hypothetical protein KGJ98_11725 [Chloroflexota bacterium]|nr:hypothetical protein [Chloroflexota bacterium]